MVRKLLLCMVAFLIGMATCAATNQVGNDSCKTVNLVYGKKLKSLINKDEIGSIKKLVLVCNRNSAFTFTPKDYEFLCKFPTLEVLACPEIIVSKIQHIADDEKKTHCLKIKDLILTDGRIRDYTYTYKGKSLSEDMREYESFNERLASRFRIKPEKYSETFPTIERVTYKNYTFKLSSGDTPDKVYFPHEGDWRVFVSSDSCLVYEKKNVNKDFDGYIVVTKDGMEGGLNQARYVNLSLLKERKNPHKIFIPKNVRYINNDMNSDQKKEITEVEIEEGDKLLYINYNVFYGTNANTLTFNRPIQIVSNAFGYTNFETLTFNKCVENIEKDAFKDANINTITFNGEVDNIEENAFGENTKVVIFKQVPQNAKPAFGACEEFYIPKGSESNFIGWGFPELSLYTPDYKPASYTLKMEKPNSIMSVLPKEKLERADSLTIIGFMYETDVKVLNLCKRLRYLDLSKTIITYSPEKRAEMKANAEMWSSIFSSLGAIADAKYNDYSMSTLDHAYAKGFTKLMQNALVTKAEIGCIIPKRTLVGLRKLTTLILPERASKIEDNAITGCVSLKNVKLPKFLQYIGSGCFADCTSLENVDFPSTLNYLGCSGSYGQKGAFANSSLRKMDLSKCYFENNAYDYGKCWKYSVGSIKNLIEIKLPKGVTSVKVGGNKSAVLYVPANIKYLDAWDFDTIHFASPTPPEFRNDYGFHSVIYIPKGSTTAYYSVFGDKVTYKEE